MVHIILMCQVMSDHSVLMSRINSGSRKGTIMSDQVRRDLNFDVLVLFPANGSNGSLVSGIRSEFRRGNSGVSMI